MLAGTWHSDLNKCLLMNDYINVYSITDHVLDPGKVRGGELGNTAL